MMKMKKFMSLLMLMVVLLPVLVYAIPNAVSITDYDSEVEAVYCYEKTLTKYGYKNSSSVPKSITYQEGNHAGTLYLISTKAEKNGITATFQGVICNGGQAYSYPVQ